MKSHRHIQFIIEPYCRSFKLLYTKIWNFAFFVRRKVTDAYYLLFFLKGDRIEIMVLEDRESVHSNGI